MNEYALRAAEASERQTRGAAPEVRRSALAPFVHVFGDERELVRYRMDRSNPTKAAFARRAEAVGVEVRAALGLSTVGAWSLL